MNEPSGPELEKLIGALARARGGVAYKFTSPGRRGVPDRLIVLPGGRVAFVEAKGRGDRIRPSQGREVQRLRDLGFDVWLVSSFTEIRDFFLHLDTKTWAPKEWKLARTPSGRTYLTTDPIPKGFACPRRH